jgi:hypothetical protein
MSDEQNTDAVKDRKCIEQFWVVDAEDNFQVEAGPFNREEEAHWTRADALHLKVVKTRHPIYETWEE